MQSGLKRPAAGTSVQMMHGEIVGIVNKIISQMVAKSDGVAMI